MKTISLKSRIGADGLLKIKVPTNEKEVDVDVVVIIQPENKKKSAWPEGFFDATYGSFRKEPLKRPPQGEYPDREPLK